MSYHVSSSMSLALKTLSDFSSRPSQRRSPSANRAGSTIPGGKPKSKALQPGVQTLAQSLPISPLPPSPLRTHEAGIHPCTAPQSGTHNTHSTTADPSATTVESPQTGPHSFTEDENEIDDPGGTEYYRAVAAHQTNLDYSMHNHALPPSQRYAAYVSVNGSIWFSTRAENHVFAASTLFQRLPDYIMALDWDSQRQQQKGRREPVSPLGQTPVAEWQPQVYPASAPRVPLKEPLEGKSRRDSGVRHRRCESEGVLRGRGLGMVETGRTAGAAGLTPDGMPMFGSIRLRESMRRKKVPAQTLELD